VGRNPLTILDGAHHPAAVAALRASLDHLLAGARPVLLFGALSDKDVAAMAAHLAGLAGTIVLTAAPGTPRAIHAGDLAKVFEDSEARLLLEDDPDRALALALDEAGTSGTLVVCGSLYLVGYVREILLRSGVAR
jgi:dihydrofolate synthase/folylpolyglutamate synthase